MVDGEADWRERAIRDAVLAGDMAAWRAWYAEYFDRMAAYVRWRCGGLADLADDAIQETWLTAVRRLRSFDPREDRSSSGYVASRRTRPEMHSGRAGERPDTVDHSNPPTTRLTEPTRQSLKRASASPTHSRPFLSTTRSCFVPSTLNR